MERKKQNNQWKKLRNRLEEQRWSVRGYAREHGLCHVTLNRIVTGNFDEGTPRSRTSPTYLAFLQLKKDGLWIGKFPWHSAIDPFSAPYKGLGWGALDENENLIISTKALKSKKVEGELKILLSLLDALASMNGYTVFSDKELAAILDQDEIIIQKMLVSLLGQKFISVETLGSIRKIRIEVEA